MILTCVDRKGSKTDPPKYQSILLLLVPGEVFNHILLQKIKQQSEKFIEENHYRFHPK